MQTKPVTKAVQPTDLRRLMASIAIAGPAYVNPPPAAAIYYAARDKLLILPYKLADKMSADGSLWKRSFEPLADLKESALKQGVKLHTEPLRHPVFVNLLVAYPGEGQRFADSSDGDYFLMKNTGGKILARIKFPGGMMKLKDHVIYAEQEIDDRGNSTISVDGEFVDKTFYVQEGNLKVSSFPGKAGHYRFNLDPHLPRDMTPLSDRGGKTLPDDASYLLRKDGPTITLAAYGGRMGGTPSILMDLDPCKSAFVCLVVPPTANQTASL